MMFREISSSAEKAARGRTSYRIRWVSSLPAVRVRITSTHEWETAAQWVRKTPSEHEPQVVDSANHSVWVAGVRKTDVFDPNGLFQSPRAIAVFRAHPANGYCTISVSDVDCVVAAIVAVTVRLYVPAGVPFAVGAGELLPPPPQPDNKNSSTRVE